MRCVSFGLVCVCVLLSVSAAENPSAAKTDLLRNVSAIDSGGVPGVVLCGGGNAFPLVGAKRDGATLPVAAAACYGKGRVVAVGHPSFWSSEGLAKADTAAFATNALAWLGQGKNKVAVHKNADFARALRALGGFDVIEIPSLDALTPGFVLAAYPDSLQAGDIERVRAFITSGGGLLASGIGWGWQQVSGGKSRATENMFNRLLGPAGLLITGQTAERTDKRGYRADGVFSPGVNITEAAALAAAGTTADPVVLRQVNATLCAAKSVLPPGADSEIAKAVNALLASPAAAKQPSKAAPLKPADIPARLALLEQQNAWRARPLATWPAQPSAAAYPGLPPAEAPRGRRALTVTLDIPRWHSTGLYAAAGEAVTAELPAGAEKLGLRLRIGSTTCDNTGHDHWSRAPKVDVEVPLKAAKTTFSSPFGGLLYVVVPDKVEAAERTVKVTLSNASQAPWFKAGRDSADAWRKKIRTAPAPWAELESEKIILTVPSDVVRTLDDPEALLRFWESVADLDAKLTSIPPQRRSAERFVSDVQLCAGWMHAGYPIMIPLQTAKEIVDLPALKAKGDWGFFHELGHNHQSGDWTFSGTGEVTVNFFTLYDLEHICGILPRQTRMGEPGIQKQVRKWVAGGKNHEEWCKEPFLALETFVRLQQAYGWKTFETLFAEYRALPQAERPKNDGEKRDQWATRLSRITGQNIAAVFDAWSIPLSDAARQACAKYPRPTSATLFADVL